MWREEASRPTHLDHTAYCAKEATPHDHLVAAAGARLDERRPLRPLETVHSRRRVREQSSRVGHDARRLALRHRAATRADAADAHAKGGADALGEPRALERSVPLHLAALGGVPARVERVAGAVAHVRLRDAARTEVAAVQPQQVAARRVGVRLPRACVRVGIILNSTYVVPQCTHGSVRRDARGSET